MTVEEARTLAHEKLVAVSKGVDPVAEEAKAAGLLTVAEICDWYICRSRGRPHPWSPPPRHQGVYTGDGSQPD